MLRCERYHIKKSIDSFNAFFNAPNFYDGVKAPSGQANTSVMPIVEGSLTSKMSASTQPGITQDLMKPQAFNQQVTLATQTNACSKLRELFESFSSPSTSDFFGLFKNLIPNQHFYNAASMTSRLSSTNTQGFGALEKKYDPNNILISLRPWSER